MTSPKHPAIVELRRRAAHAGFIIDGVHWFSHTNEEGRMCGEIFYDGDWFTLSANARHYSHKDRLMMTGSTCAKSSKHSRWGDCIHGGVVIESFDQSNYRPFKENMTDEDWVMKCMGLLLAAKKRAEVWTTTTICKKCGDEVLARVPGCYSCFQLREYERKVWA